VPLSPAERRGALWRVGGVFSKRDRKFESGFLQQRVTCELDFRSWLAATDGGIGKSSSWPLFVPHLPEPTAHQGEDFPLNLRIVQQAQKRLFKSLVSLGLLDLVFSFGSIVHRAMMT
jgi:hypothetical protein